MLVVGILTKPQEGETQLGSEGATRRGDEIGTRSA